MERWQYKKKKITHTFKIQKDNLRTCNISLIMAPCLFNKLIMNGIGLSLNLFVLCFRNSNFFCFLRVMLEWYSEGGNQLENFLEVEHLTANSLHIRNLRSSSDSSSSFARELGYDVYSQPRICLQTRFWMFSTWFTCFWVRPGCQRGAAYSKTGLM